VADEIKAFLARPEPAADQTVASALGGRPNIRAVQVRGSRLLIELIDSQLVDWDAVRTVCPRGSASTGSNTLQLLVGRDAADVAGGLARAS